MGATTDNKPQKYTDSTLVCLAGAAVATAVLMLMPWGMIVRGIGAAFSAIWTSLVWASLMAVNFVEIYPNIATASMVFITLALFCLSHKERNHQVIFASKLWIYGVVLGVGMPVFISFTVANTGVAAHGNVSMRVSQKACRMLMQASVAHTGRLILKIDDAPASSVAQCGLVNKLFWMPHVSEVAVL